MTANRPASSKPAREGRGNEKNNESDEAKTRRRPIEMRRGVRRETKREGGCGVGEREMEARQTHARTCAQGGREGRYENTRDLETERLRE